ncbi:MAG: hypothetical protein B7Y83_03300 [Flavobacteriales bacterium 32-34-25]|nr:MAG: hypothetical protein B7Y83_03300 [Flavobacteriales bacterium 32-34-25]
MNLNKFMLSFCFAVSMLLSSCGADHVDSSLNPDPVPDPVTNTGKKKVISSYIRYNFYESSRVSNESLMANNDLIMIAFRPYSDGSIYCDLPDSQASFSNVSYLSSFEGRNGVADFGGAGSDMNAGLDLINNVKSFESDGSYKQFTFGTWLYLDTWTPGAYIFKKENTIGNILYCKMGATNGVLEFNSDGKIVSVPATGLALGGWHHFALAYNGNNAVSDRVTAYVDGVKLTAVNTPSDFPTSVSYMKAPFHIGVDIDGKMDETFLNSLYLTSSALVNYKNNGIKLRNTDWNSTKTLSYWKYNSASNMGEDSQSWKSIYKDIRSTIQGKDIKLRLGITGGDWKTVFSNPSARTAFVNNVSNFISENDLDGVDFDFEWSTTETEYNNYSSAIVEMANKLKSASPKVTFSVSLHPFSYKITKQAIDAVDFISMQHYGPQPTLFPYDAFVSYTGVVVDYGIPVNKLVLGVPFYGAESNGNKGTEAYFSFVNAGLITSPDLDQVTYNGKTFIFNGQSTIRKKAQFVKNMGYLGMMSWDLATDVSSTNNLSLMKVVNEELSED